MYHGAHCFPCNTCRLLLWTALLSTDTASESEFSDLWVMIVGWERISVILCIWMQGFYQSSNSTQRRNSLTNGTAIHQAAKIGLNSQGHSLKFTLLFGSRPTKLSLLNNSLASMTDAWNGVQTLFSSTCVRSALCGILESPQKTTSALSLHEMGNMPLSVCLSCLSDWLLVCSPIWVPRLLVKYDAALLTQPFAVVADFDTKLSKQGEMSENFVC